MRSILNRLNEVKQKNKIKIKQTRIFIKTNSFLTQKKIK